MRAFVLPLLLAVLFSGSGCDSLPTRMRDRLDPQPQIRVYQADEKAVFEAARAAVGRIDFIVARAGQAQGLIKAHSPLRSSDTFGKARQYAMEVRIQSFDPGTTQVAVILREQEESASFAGATDIPLREHGLYDSYFAAIEATLGQAGKEAAVPR
jgi:hypothetical protein